MNAQTITNLIDEINQMVMSIDDTDEHQSSDQFTEEKYAASQSPVVVPSFSYEEIEKDFEFLDGLFLDNDALDTIIQNNQLELVAANTTIPTTSNTAWFTEPIPTSTTNTLSSFTCWPTSPNLSDNSSSSSSKRESSFDKSTFVSKTKRSQKKDAKVLTYAHTNFQRLNGRSTYVKIVNQFATCTTLNFKVFTKRTDGKGTKFDSDSLNFLAEVNVECELEPNTTNYINMKTTDKNSILSLSHLKKNLPVPRGHELWIKIQDSNEFFNIYCQKGKQDGFSVHNVITCTSNQFSNTYEVDSLARLSHGSITPKNITFTFKN